MSVRVCDTRGDARDCVKRAASAASGYGIQNVRDRAREQERNRGGRRGSGDESM